MEKRAVGAGSQTGGTRDRASGSAIQARANVDTRPPRALASRRLAPGSGDAPRRVPS